MEDTILNDVLRVLIGLFIERKQTLLVNRYIVQTVRSKMEDERSLQTNCNELFYSSSRRENKIKMSTVTWK